MSTEAEPPKGRLISHFSERPRQRQAEGWAALWETDENDLWDRGMASPALVDFVESKPDVIQKPSDGRRLKALVPGCGRGYDVAMLALHGFDAYGLEVSPKGANVAEEYSLAQLKSPAAHNFGPGGAPQPDRGSAIVVAGDFFQRDWEESCFAEGEQHGFDLIYDYTFLCALLPEMRRDWALRMQDLLSPTGVLVCLEFPMYKGLGAPGPPWGLRGVHWDLLARGGDGRLSEPQEETVADGGSFERLRYFKPQRTYEAGGDTDMVSVWRKRLAVVVYERADGRTARKRIYESKRLAIIAYERADGCTARRRIPDWEMPPFVTYVRADGCAARKYIADSKMPDVVVYVRADGRTARRRIYDLKPSDFVAYVRADDRAARKRIYD